MTLHKMKSYRSYFLYRYILVLTHITTYLYYTCIKNCLMSFSGKKFRRVRCENVKNLLASTSDEEMKRMLKVKAPLVTYTIGDGGLLYMDLEVDGKHLKHSFKLGEEQDVQKKDGGKVKITYTLEGNNILNQVIKMDGKTAYLKREFKDNGVVMTIKLDGTDLSATIYYDIVN